MRKKRGFSLLELSIVLLVIAVIIGMITQSSDVLQTARLSTARSITKSSVVNDIPGLILWLDATSEDAFDTAMDDGTTVANWNDINPNPNNVTPYIATQGTVANRPTYRKAILNDLPGLDFDGVNDNFVISNFKANSYMTLFVVGNFSPVGGKTAFIEHSVSMASNDGFYFYGFGNKVGGVSRNGTVINGTFDLNWFKGYITSIGVLRYDGTNISYKRNSNSFTNSAGSIPNTSVTTNLYIGSEAGSILFSDGAFGEIIMFDRALSDTEVNDIVTYLTKKWQIE